MTASCGIAGNKMLAKICSDIKKPDGQSYLKPDLQVIRDFMTNMSVRKIPGIGRMTELVLASMGIYTCQDVLDKAVEIYLSFTEKTT